MENVTKRIRQDGKPEIRLSFGRKKVVVMSKSSAPPHYTYVTLYDNRSGKYKNNSMFLGKDEFDELFSMKNLLDALHVELERNDESLNVTGFYNPSYTPSVEPVSPVTDAVSYLQEKLDVKDSTFGKPIPILDRKRRFTGEDSNIPKKRVKFSTDATVSGISEQVYDIPREIFDEYFM